MMVKPDVELVDRISRSREQLIKLGLTPEEACLQDAIIDTSSENGLVLVGRHRKNSYKDWPEKKIDTKSNPLLRELIIIHGNVQRVISQEETKARLRRVAWLLENNGMKKEDVCHAMADIVPYSERHIERCLPPEYKRKYTKSEPKSEEALEMSEEKTDVDALPAVNAESITGNREQSAAKATDAFSKAFSEDPEMPKYPFPECKCPGCPKEAVCPKVMV